MQRIDGKHEVVHRLATNQMLVYDAFHHRFIHGVVPNTVGVDNGNRATLAHPKTVGPGA